MFSELGLILGYDYSQDKSHILVDVGAHVGMVSLPFLKKGWKVIAFEAEESNRNKLISTLGGYSTFTCIPKAVSDVSGEHVPFYISDKHYGIHSLMPWHASHEMAYEVETTRLDDALSGLEVSEVTVLKIDIEGADFLALRGFDFNRWRPAIVMVEFMDGRTIDNFGYSYHDMVSYMQGKGYASFISKWAPIEEYAREGIKGKSHDWLACTPYSAQEEPAWGNIIFVPEADREKFQCTLDKYIRRTGFLSVAKRIPGLVHVYRYLRSFARRF